MASAAAAGRKDYVHLTSHFSLPHRVVLATLTGRPVHISGIRSDSANALGLAPDEYAFMRLLERVTNGSSIEFSQTGTHLRYNPGLIVGSMSGLGATGDGGHGGGADASFEHEITDERCTRGITYYLIPLALLAPFAKAHLNVRIHGRGVVTSATEAGDMSVDSFRTAILPLYGLFGIPPQRIELRVLHRSCAGGGGDVELRFAGQVRLPKTLHLARSPGAVRRIRGVAYSTGVAASSNGRMIYAAREILNPLVPDINIAAQYDAAPRIQSGRKGSKGSKSSNPKGGIGFGLSLVAETSAEGVIYSADIASPRAGGVVAEDLGKQCAYQLLEIISQGGCVSPTAAPTVLTLMAMGSEDVGRLRMGRDVLGSEPVVGLAKDLKAFGCSSWGLRKMDTDQQDVADYLVAVKGSGVGNVGRKIA